MYLIPLDGVETNQSKFALPRSIYLHTLAVIGGTRHLSNIIDHVGLTDK